MATNRLILNEGFPFLREGGGGQEYNKCGVTEMLWESSFSPLGTPTAVANQKYESIIRMLMNSAKHLHTYQHIRLREAQRQ